MLQKKNKSLRNEVDSHEPRIQSVMEVGQSLIDEGHPQSDQFRTMLEDLKDRWQRLLEAVENRRRRLELSEVSQQVTNLTKRT